MKRFLFLLLLSLSVAVCGGAEAHAAQVDTAALFSQMEQYLAAIDRLSPQAACIESDFMISSVADSTMRNTVAVRAYRHFRNSRVMGSENVAVYIYDGWFATYRALFDSVDEFEEAGLYAFVNRQSLLGCRPSRLTMEDMEGNEISFPFPNGRRSIIYFYSTECPKCLVTSLQLSEFLNVDNPGIDVFAVYTGDDTAAWRAYVDKNLKISASSPTVYHLRGGDADFVTVYGVVQTPRLFFLNGSDVVAGRHLDVDAISKLLH